MAFLKPVAFDADAPAACANAQAIASSNHKKRLSFWRERLHV
jgi:hypothetical protein